MKQLCIDCKHITKRKKFVCGKEPFKIFTYWCRKTKKFEFKWLMVEGKKFECKLYEKEE